MSSPSPTTEPPADGEAEAKPPEPPERPLDAARRALHAGPDASLVIRLPRT